MNKRIMKKHVKRYPGIAFKKNGIHGFLIVDDKPTIKSAYYWCIYRKTCYNNISRFAKHPELIKPIDEIERVGPYEIKKYDGMSWYNFLIKVPVIWNKIKNNKKYLLDSYLDNTSDINTSWLGDLGGACYCRAKSYDIINDDEFFMTVEISVLCDAAYEDIKKLDLEVTVDERLSEVNPISLYLTGNNEE